MSFDSLGLPPELGRAIADEGYTVPTPIQLAAIPLVRSGRDLLAAAQTGTGKTAAFALPILERLMQHANASFSPARHPVRALVITPTRELAMQVEESFRVYGRHLALRSTAVYGGVDIDPQIKALHAGVEILVATPGRLLDHVGQRTVSFGQVEVLVLDEGDRMLDMGFLPDIKRILALLPAKRQNMLFSATFSEEIRRLAGELLHDPATVEVAPRNTVAETVRQIVYPVEHERKRELLAHLVRHYQLGQVLCFTRTKIEATRLATWLDRNGIEAVAIHSDRTQGERTKALEAFKRGELRVLVATDVAARGLDIEDLPVVVNYELPTVAQDYIHRIGRTGRAGQTGEAISLVSAEEVDLLRAIQRLLKRAIPWRVEEGFVPQRPTEEPHHIRVRGDAPRSAPPGGDRGGAPRRSRAPVGG